MKKPSKCIAVRKDGERYFIGCYASGSGALSILVRAESNMDVCASHYKPSLKQVQKLRDTHYPEMMIVLQSTGPKTAEYVLLQPSERRGKDILLHRGLLYRYEEDKNDQWGFRLYTRPTALRCKGVELEVHHISTKAAVKYFLENEFYVVSNRVSYDNSKLFLPPGQSPLEY